MYPENVLGFPDMFLSSKVDSGTVLLFKPSVAFLTSSAFSSSVNACLGVYTSSYSFNSFSICSSEAQALSKFLFMHTIHPCFVAVAKPSRVFCFAITLKTLLTRGCILCVI